MPVVRIADLAKAMIDELAPRYAKDPEEIKIVEIGTKAGEKLYEELMSLEETRRAVELKTYFSVLPAFRGIYQNIDYSYEDILTADVNNPYVSENESALSIQEIKEFLRDNDLLVYPAGQIDERYWPGDKEERQ